MVSKQQKQMQKKKDREKESRKKVLAKRDKLRAEAKEKRLEFRRDKRIARLQREIDSASIGNDWVPGGSVPLEELPDNVLAQIEHNVKVLKALEVQHEKEAKERQELNEGLEEEGHLTGEDKIKALRRKFLEGLPAQDIELPKLPEPRKAKDVSDVEVVRAPVEEVPVDEDAMVVYRLTERQEVPIKDKKIT